MVEAKEKRPRSRLTSHLPQDQIKAVKLLKIFEGRDLSMVVGEALDVYIDSRYGEGIAAMLKQAETLDDVEAILGDFQNFQLGDVKT